MTQAAPIFAADPSPTAQPAPIRIDNLTHRYPPSRRSRPTASSPSASSANSARGSSFSASGGPALDNVSLEVNPREIFGILGPNGGGKTTLFRILSTSLRPTSGNVTIFGHDVVAEAALVRQQLGVVFQMPSLDVKLTAYENLLHQGHLYGISGADLDQRITDALTRMNLHERRDERVERFSGGMRRRVELAKALLHHPRLLLLDEPATGLDPGARRELWSQLEYLRREQGVTIALTTHLMEEADRCDRLAILASGQLRAIDTPANLKARIGGDVATIETDAQADDAARQALALAITQRYAPWAEGAEPRVVDGKIRLEHAHGPAFVATLAGDFPNQIHAITVGRPTLEDVFMSLTGQALDQEDEAPPARPH